MYQVADMPCFVEAKSHNHHATHCMAWKHVHAYISLGLTACVAMQQQAAEEQWERLEQVSMCTPLPMARRSPWQRLLSQDAAEGLGQEH